MYRDSDVILICFDIGHPPSLRSVVNKVDTLIVMLLSPVKGPYYDNSPAFLNWPKDC